MFALKFYAQKDSKSDFKYSHIINKGDVYNILLTCLKAVPIILEKYPGASFGFIGARTVDPVSKRVEGFSYTQLTRIYTKIVEQKIGFETFAHLSYVTKKRVDDGYNGTVNSKYRFPEGGPATGGSFAFKEKKFALSSIVGASLNNTPFNTSSIKRISRNTLPAYLDQNNYKNSNSKTVYLGSEFSYELDKYSLIFRPV